MRSHVTRLLEARILEEIARQENSLGLGAAVSYENYQGICGYIRGLRAALTLCDEIESEREA